MKLVLVEWVDSYSMPGWQDLDELKKNQAIDPCFTVGWIVQKTKESILLVSSLSSEDNEKIATSAQGNMCIPMVAVKKIKYLRQV